MPTNANGLRLNWDGSPFYPMDQNPAPEASSPLEKTVLGRRELLRVGAIGASALGLAGLAPLAEAAQTGPRNERQFRAQLLRLGTLSLKSATLGQQKAQNAGLKVFATFEATEQKALGKVLKEMDTPVRPLTAAEQQVVARHQSATGEEFDRVFAQAQLDTHLKLRDLLESFIENSKGRGMAETHTRHLATVALPAVLEHIAHAKAYVAAVRA